jgi:hypothetical protein
MVDKGLRNSYSTDKYNSPSSLSLDRHRGILPIYRELNDALQFAVESGRSVYVVMYS